MDNLWSERLREALANKGWSQTELSKRADIPYANVNKYFTGSVKQPRGEVLEVIASALDVDYLWLLTGQSNDTTIPVMGYIGAGQEIFSVSDNEIERVEAPPNSNGTSIATIVRGDSARPIFDPGTILYYSKTTAPSDMLNRKAICKISDGRLMLKIIRNGSDYGKFTLQSINLSYPDIVDVTLEWAAPIDWIKPNL